MSHAIRINQRAKKFATGLLILTGAIGVAAYIVLDRSGQPRVTIESVQIADVDTEVPIAQSPALADEVFSPGIGLGVLNVGGTADDSVAAENYSLAVEEQSSVEPTSVPRADPTSSFSVAAESVEVKSDTDRVLESLREANAAFNTPEAIHLHRTKRVHFLLSPDVPVDVLEAMIDASDGDPVEPASIKFHQRMEAKLTGAGFEIQPITREIQGVASHGVTEWKWDVTAMETGTHTLHLSVSVLFKADGVDTGTSIKTFEQDIVVEVRALDLAKDFILSEWQWLWSAILVPFAGWLWFGWRTRRARGKEQGLESARFYAVG